MKKNEINSNEKHISKINRSNPLNARSGYGRTCQLNLLPEIYPTNLNKWGVSDNRQKKINKSLKTIMIWNISPVVVDFKWMKCNARTELLCCSTSLSFVKWAMSIMSINVVMEMVSKKIKSYYKTLPLSLLGYKANILR